MGRLMPKWVNSISPNSLPRFAPPRRNVRRMFFSVSPCSWRRPVLHRLQRYQCGAGWDNRVTRLPCQGIPATGGTGGGIGSPPVANDHRICLYRLTAGDHAAPYLAPAAAALPAVRSWVCTPALVRKRRNPSMTSNERSDGKTAGRAPPSALPLLLQEVLQGLASPEQ